MKVEILDVMGSDLTVANAARVSFAVESEEFGSRDKKLIRYLAKHKALDTLCTRTGSVAYQSACVRR